MKEYIKPEVEVVNFETEAVAKLDGDISTSFDW